MKWICPNCPELMHGTRHESVVRHINRKHQTVGEPVSFNTGLTRIQMGLKSNLQAPYARGLSKRLPPYPLSPNTNPKLVELYGWTENQVLRPMRQLLEFTNLRHQLGARNVRDFQNMAQSNASSYTCDEQLKIITKNLFGCRVFLCENCSSFEIHPFYFCDPRVPQSESTIVEHSCPSNSYTMLKCIPDNEKMIFRDYMNNLTSFICLNIVH
jgi:hypothetical protein